MLRFFLPAARAGSLSKSLSLMHGDGGAGYHSGLLVYDT